MALFSFEGKRPVIGQGTYVSESAEVIGDVTIGESCYIGPGAVLRGDYGTIVIGSYSAVEDNCIIHARPDHRCELGEYVTVGHGAIVHNAVLSDYVSVGMGAVISNDVEIGSWSIVGEGCVVKASEKVPPEKVVVGVPGKIVGDVTEEQRKFWTWGKQVYAELPKRCMEGLRRI
jgi:carbonic anhydrase/acetyltransferase-like protein (isoleucine patch superfamily)